MKFHLSSHLARALALVMLVAAAAVLAVGSPAWANPALSTSTQCGGRSTVPCKETDVSIVKTFKPAGSDDYIFTLTIKNTGKIAAEDVVVNDQLSKYFELEYVKGAKCSGERNIKCNLGTLGAGKTVTIEIRVDVEPDNFKGSITNTATVSTKTKDTNLNNNRSSVTVKVSGKPETDVSVSKKARSAGRTDFIFTITVKNNGKIAAEDVVMTDQLSKYFGLVYVKGAKCISGQKVSCSLGTLGAGKTVTIEIRVTVKPNNYSGSIPNTATVSSRTRDTNLSNNTSSVTVKATGGR